MIKITFKHPLHGLQTMECPHATKEGQTIRLKNIHGATFQVIEIEWLIDIESGMN